MWLKYVIENNVFRPDVVVKYLISNNVVRPDVVVKYVIWNNVVLMRLKKEEVCLKIALFVPRWSWTYTDDRTLDSKN